jgi:hypothetical protein
MHGKNKKLLQFTTFLIIHLRTSMLIIKFRAGAFKASAGAASHCGSGSTEMMRLLAAKQLKFKSLPHRCLNLRVKG